MSHNDDRGHHGGPGHNPEAALMILVAGFFVAVILLRGARDKLSSAMAEGPQGVLDLALSSVDWVLDAILNDFIGAAPSLAHVLHSTEVGSAVASVLASALASDAASWLSPLMAAVA